jgi:hypothetical protein
MSQAGAKALDSTHLGHLDKDVTLSDLSGKNVVLAILAACPASGLNEPDPADEAETACFVGLNAQILGIGIPYVPSRSSAARPGRK